MAGPPELTERHWAVLRALADAGGSSKIAARELGISRATVRNHRTEIYRRLEVQSLTEAYRALGWLVVPRPGRSVSVPFTIR